MGLITSKVHEMIVFVLSSLGILNLLVLKEPPERIRVTSDASANAGADPTPMAWDHDLSEESFAFRMTEFREWLERDQLLEPEAISLSNRETLVEAQHRHRMTVLQASQNECQKKTTVFGLPKHFSATPMALLERIPLSGMFLRKRNAGRFLLCRTIAPCVHDVDVQLIVEDPEGDVYTVVICNFPTIIGESLAYLDMLFPVRLVMAIREPVIARPLPGNPPHPFIRVDSPTDIMFPHPKSDLMANIIWTSDLNVHPNPNATPLLETWRSLGNQHFKIGRLLPAAFAYSRELDIDPSAHLLRLNRAEVYLRLGYYSAALADAEYVLALPDLLPSARIKALYRSGKAHYGRRDYASAVNRFKEISNLSPGNADAAAGLTRAQARLKESTSGRYEWTRLFKESQALPRVDVADFVGPVLVESIEKRGGGRGIVATRNVHIGEILVVAKPLASVYPEDLSSTEELRAFDLRTGKLHTKCQTALVSRVVEKIYGNLDLHDDVMSLYSGPESKHLPTFPPVSLRNVQHLNPLAPGVNIDVAQIEAICALNNFMPNSLEIGQHDATTESPAALYLLPSLFNHACASNAVWHCIGDAMIIRATEDIAAGEEITIPYACSESYQERRAALAVYIPNGCDCRLCEEDRKDGEEAYERRERLVSEFNRLRLSQGPADALGAARTFAEDVMSTFSPERSGVLPRMINAHHSIAVALQEVAYDADREMWPTYFKEAIAEDFKALESAGISVVDKSMWGPVVHKRTMPIATKILPSFIPHENFGLIMLSIAYSFNVLKDRRRVVRWIKAAAWIEKIAIGANKELFLLRHGATLEHHGLHSIAVEAL